MYLFYSSCVNWALDVYEKGGLCDMIEDASSVCRRTFLKHVDREFLKEMEISLGYDSRFHMASDWHVKYCKSKLYVRTVYFFVYSGIEFVFVTAEQLEQLNERRHFLHAS